MSSELALHSHIVWAAFFETVLATPSEETGDTHLLPQDLDQGFGSHLHGLGMFLKCVLEVLQVYLKLQKTSGESYQAGLLRGKMVEKIGYFQEDRMNFKS